MFCLYNEAFRSPKNQGTPNRPRIAPHAVSRSSPVVLPTRGVRHKGRMVPFSRMPPTQIQGKPNQKGAEEAQGELVGYRVVRNAPSTAGNSMTGSERPSPEPLLKKEAPPAVLGGREFWKCFGSLKCLELQSLGHPSRTLEGNSRKRSESVSGVFP